MFSKISTPKYGVFLVRLTEEGRGLRMCGGLSLRYRYPVAYLGIILFILSGSTLARNRQLWTVMS